MFAKPFSRPALARCLNRLTELFNEREGEEVDFSLLIKAYPRRLHRKHLIFSNMTLLKFLHKNFDMVSEIFYLFDLNEHKNRKFNIEKGTQVMFELLKGTISLEDMRKVAIES